MNKVIQLILVLILIVFGCSAIALLYNQDPPTIAIIPNPASIGQKIPSIPHKTTIHPAHVINPFNTLEPILAEQAPSLKTHIISTALTTLYCANEMNIPHNQILTIIDYSLPTNQKRLWVFDLEQKKLLFHTYIAHGIKSGTVYTNSFSNTNNSKATSRGVFLTDKAYYGREGTALKLTGLDAGINDNAANRSIVMHGGWYADEAFIQKYGRTGRSWGCPALPLHSAKAIINTIKDQSLLIAYYPNEAWLMKSPFLRCNPLLFMQTVNESNPTLLPSIKEPEDREDILFVDLNGNSQHEENEPILVIGAKDYEAFFQKKAPLGRMLRRQINQSEYIALTQSELRKIISAQEIRQEKIKVTSSSPLPTHVIPTPNESAERDLQNSTSMRTIGAYSSQAPRNDREITTVTLDKLNLVIPEIKMHRGYYQTEMKVISLGQINQIQYNGSLERDPEANDTYTLILADHKTMLIKSTSHFIRWLGL